MDLNHKKILNNERGSVSLIGAFFFMTFIAITFYNMAKSYEELHIIKHYNKSYICAKKTVKHYNDFYKFISQTNIVIRSFFYGKFIPILSWLRPFLSYGEKGLKILQVSYRFYFRLKLLQISECSSLNIVSLMKDDPLGQKVWKIKRQFDGGAIFQKEWKGFMPFHYKGSDLSENHSFVITLKFKLKKGYVLDDFTLNSRHMAPMGFQQLKEYYGLQFL